MQKVGLFSPLDRNEYEELTPLWAKLCYFLIGFLGLNLIVLLVELILPSSFIDSEGYLTIGGSVFLNVLSYVILAAVLIPLFLCSHRKDIKKFFAQFKGCKPWIWAAVGFAGILAVNMISNVINYAFDIGSNTNQTSINDLVLHSPFPMFLMVVLCGPICEEITYRAGLMDLIGTKKKWVGLVVSALIFGFIHFDWTCFFAGNSSLILVEFINLPVYILSGLILGFVYYKSGRLSSSMLAHIAVNLFSYLSILSII